MVDPDHIPSFVEWRDQGDLRLTVWNYLNYGLRLDLDTLAAVSALFAPSFVEREGCVLLASNSDEDNFATWWNRTNGNRHAVESQLNHVHLRDLLGVETTDERLLAEVAETVSSLWRAALERAFPDRAFLVDLVAVEEDPSGPILRFSQA